MNDSHGTVSARNLRFASLIFYAAAIYGFPILVLMAIHPAMALGDRPVAQPEFFYGFTAVALTWQVVFVLIARDPLRYRPIMLVAAVGEKFLFVVALIVLMADHRAPTTWVPAAVIDGVLGFAFLIAYRVTSPLSSAGSPA